MKKHFLLLLLLISIQLLGQTKKNGTIKIKKADTLEISFDSVDYANLDELPQFPGGNQAMFLFISQNINYPDSAKSYGISGICYISFNVNEKGKLSDLKVLRGVKNCVECDMEAIKTIQLMPDWIPAQQKEKPVKVKYLLPIKFTLR
jgi:protein TonB